MVEEMKKRKPGRPKGSKSKANGKPAEPIPFQKPAGANRSFTDAEVQAGMQLAVTIAQANPHLNPLKVAKTIGDLMERIIRQKKAA